VLCQAPIRFRTSPGNSNNRFCGNVPVNGGTLPRRAADSSKLSMDTTAINIAVCR